MLLNISQEFAAINSLVPIEQAIEEIDGTVLGQVQTPYRFNIRAALCDWPIYHLAAKFKISLGGGV
jgi:hypothetical protein